MKIKQSQICLLNHFIPYFLFHSTVILFPHKRQKKKLPLKSKIAVLMVSVRTNFALPQLLILLHLWGKSVLWVKIGFVLYNFSLVQP